MKLGLVSKYSYSVNAPNLRDFFCTMYYLLIISFISVCHSESPAYISHVHVYIRVMDINDNAPQLQNVPDIYVCERSRIGQVLYKKLFSNLNWYSTKLCNTIVFILVIPAGP